MDQEATLTRILLDTARGKTTDRVPFWFMRQAGRYLPEYRALRAKAGSFLNMCYTPDFAVEVTIQPIRRFQMDGAILFSDILVIPDALGQKLDYVEGEGPVLEPIRDQAGLSILQPGRVLDHLSPVFEAVKRLRRDLPDETTLIGFAGAPWTVATYMIEGGGSADHARAKAWAYADPESFDRLIGLLTDVTADYLIEQIRAGADMVQIFDSWASSLPPFGFKRWGLKPAAEIVRRIHAVYPDVPVIGFPKGSGPLAADYAEQTGVAVVGIDTATDPVWAARALQPHVAVQGNLDPLLLVAGGELMDRQAKEILTALKGGRHIFNLGHGIVPHTPIEHVARLSDLIRSFSRAE